MIVASPESAFNSLPVRSRFTGSGQKRAVFVLPAPVLPSGPHSVPGPPARCSGPLYSSGRAGGVSAGFRDTRFEPPTPFFSLMGAQSRRVHKTFRVLWCWETPPRPARRGPGLPRQMGQSGAPEAAQLPGKGPEWGLSRHSTSEPMPSMRGDVALGLGWPGALHFSQFPLGADAMARGPHIWATHFPLIVSGARCLVGQSEGHYRGRGDRRPACCS